MSHSNRPINIFNIGRRSMLLGAGATALATGVIASINPALAQRRGSGGPDKVPVEKLMAKGELPDITLGKPDAQVTIVEYASMTCPHCATFHNGTFPKLKEKYIDTGKVFFVMREFPLDNLAAAASMLTRCAGEGKAAPMVGLLFETQEQWRINNPAPKLLEIAKQAGFTQATFDKCLENTDMLNKLIKQRDTASKDFGVDATPSFFINGERFRSRSIAIEAFDKVIEPLLK